MVKFEIKLSIVSNCNWNYMGNPTVLCALLSQIFVFTGCALIFSSKRIVESVTQNIFELFDQMAKSGL